MYKKRIGRLIVALRRDNMQGRKPWTRLKFAQESGIDEDTLANIENGRRTILYPDLLIKMANALNLTSGERKEFFLAAAGIDDSDVYHPLDSPKSALKNMLAIMDQLQQPAFLVDQYFDIIAVNQMVLEVYNVNVNNFLDPDSDPVTRYNLIRFLFSPEFNEQKAMLGKFREKFAANTALLFRASSLRYRGNPYFQRLYSHLCEFDDFRSYIQHKAKDEHYVDNNLFIILDNPQFGIMNSISASVTAASTAGELKLFVFTPLNQDTANIFTRIAQNGNYVFQPLPDWPDKSILAEK